jgi:hypothetical protein
MELPSDCRVINSLYIILIAQSHAAATGCRINGVIPPVLSRSIRAGDREQAEPVEIKRWQIAIITKYWRELFSAPCFSGLPTGNARLRREVEKAISIKMGHGKRSRPMKTQAK